MTETDVKRIPLTRIQKLTSSRMLKSKQTQPCFYMTAKADSFLAIPSPEQCDILSVGRIVTYDYAAQLLVEITGLVANPQKLPD